MTTTGTTGDGWSNGDGWGTGDAYEFQGNNQLGAGNTPLQNDLYTDPYSENVYQVNYGDNPYTESPANPDPELEL